MTTPSVMRGNVVVGGRAFPGSIEQVCADAAAKLLAREVPAQVVREQLDDPLVLVDRLSRRGRAQDHVVELPQRTVRRERLGGVDVERRAEEVAGAKRVD